MEIETLGPRGPFLQRGVTVALQKQHFFTVSVELQTGQCTFVSSPITSTAAESISCQNEKFQNLYICNYFQIHNFQTLHARKLDFSRHLLLRFHNLYQVFFLFLIFSLLWKSERGMAVTILQLLLRWFVHNFVKKTRYKLWEEMSSVMIQERESKVAPSQNQTLIGIVKWRKRAWIAIHLTRTPRSKLLIPRVTLHARGPW